MKRAVLLVAALTLVTGCKEKKSEEAPPPPPPTPVAAAKKEAPPPPAEEPAEKPLVIDAAMVDKYLAAQKVIVAETKVYVEKTQADLKAVQDKDSTAASLKVLANMEERSKKLDEVKRSALEKNGLSEREYAELNELVTSVELSQAMFEKAGGEAAVAKMEADIKAQLAAQAAKGTPEERAKAEKEALEMTETMRSVGQAKDARERYGDAAVDAVMKRLPEARAMREELIGLMKK